MWSSQHLIRVVTTLASVSSLSSSVSGFGLEGVCAPVIRPPLLSGIGLLRPLRVFLRLAGMLDEVVFQQPRDDAVKFVGPDAWVHFLYAGPDVAFDSLALLSIPLGLCFFRRFLGCVPDSFTGL